MFFNYVWADLVRNPRRTLSTTLGVTLGIGLSCALLFFVDGLSASMTQRAIAPLPTDMQLVLSQPVAADIQLGLEVKPTGSAQPGDIIQVQLVLSNRGQTPANEVIIRSVPTAGLRYLEGSATIGGKVVTAKGASPFASGPAKVGLNVGTVDAGTELLLSYQAEVTTALDVSEQSFASGFSTREALTPIKANAAKPLSLAEVAAQIEKLEGVAFAEQLSFADLPRAALSSAGMAVDGAVRVFGFDPSYTEHDSSIRLMEGSQLIGEALISAEAAASLSVGLGDTVSLALPGGSQLNTNISGIVDLSQARSLFSSRQGADLETFVYIPNALILDAASFGRVVVPAFEQAATGRGERVKSPPVREVDIGVRRALLDAEPSVALKQTQQLAADISALANKQDFLLDNISNTLAVARGDAEVVRRMFLFLGIPGAVLAALLAAYAGVVLSGAQRREQATLRIRGASKQHLLSMLTLRVSLITAAGAVMGVVLGYLTAAIVLGHGSLLRATLASLLRSAALGTLLGLVATGSALYFTGRRSIEREINEERAQLLQRPPAWRRYRLDLLGIAAVVLLTIIVMANAGFEGEAGSVYVGRSVKLPLSLLVLPVFAWLAGSLFGGRTFAGSLSRSPLSRSANLDRVFSLLYQSTLKRRSWALADAAIILGLIVGFSTSLAVFTASYNGAKAADAHYTVGSDLKVAPSPGATQRHRAADATDFYLEGVDAVVPIVYGVHNVVLRSHRTSDIANLAALEPEAYAQVAPLNDSHFARQSADEMLSALASNPDGILLSQAMADFLNIHEGDPLWVLLARGTSEQLEIKMSVLGTYERLPGFPDGADVLMNLKRHEEAIASSIPAFFLLQTSERSDEALQRVVKTLRSGVIGEALHIDTRLSALAKDQSSLAALNISGLLKLDSGYALAMGTVAIAIFVFGLLLQRRREYVTLRALGMQPGAIRTLINAEAGTVALVGSMIGLPVGLVMAFYFIKVLRPLFVLDPPYLVPWASLTVVLGSVLAATVLTSVLASSLVNGLKATELLRDE